MPHAGLLTFHSAINFGAMVQAWSLAQVLQAQAGEAHVIDYQPAGRQAKNRRKGWKAWLPSIGRWKMDRFMRRQMPLSPTVHTADQISTHVKTARYDCLICGSDQVWMKDDYLGFDRAYFLGVAEDVPVRRISYAPSCGSMTSFGPDAEEARRLLQRFDALSARDEHTIRLLGELGVTNVTLVVDPTLLADFAPLIRKPPMREDYLAVAGPMDGRACRFIRQIADRLKLKVLAAGTRCSTADIEQRFVDPGQWVSHLHHARFIVTSLFHGTAMSLRFRKPFIALPAAGRGFKLTDLLDRFGLSTRFVQPAEGGGYDLAPELLELDYRSTEPLIARAVDTSMQYLRSALHG